MTLAHPSDTQTDNTYLRRELERVKQQRDALAEVCQAQHALLTEISQETIVLNRHALCAVGPQIRAAPASCAKALLRLVEDLGPDGITRQGWTGLALGEELGLARATRDRLVGPLEAAGAVEAVAVTGHKTVHYRVTLALNPTLSARIEGLQIRAQRALFMPGTPDGSSVSTLPARSDPTAIRSQRVPLVPNTLSARIGGPNTPPARDVTPCMYVVDSDSGIPPGDQQHTGPPRPPCPQELAAFRMLHIPAEIYAAWLVHPAEHVLACTLHAQLERGVNNPVGLLRAMLERGQGAPAPPYITQAHQLLADRPEPVPPEGIDEDEPAADALGASPDPPPEDPGLTTRPGCGALTVRELWQAVLGALELQLNPATFDTWLRGARAARFVDGILTVHTRHAYAPQWIPRHLPHVDAMLSKLAGVPITVVYESARPLYRPVDWM
jgi:hypothetical protein